MNFKEKMQRKSGITLISLVVTIIVLLILAAVSIVTLTGENGILTKASDANERTKEANAKEQVQIAVQGSYDETGKINIDDLNTELSKINGLTYNGSPISENNKISSLPVTVVVDGYEVLIGENGVVSIVIRIEGVQTKTTKPYFPSSSFTQVSNTSLEDGLVITDGTNNWVWIEVPTNIYENTTYNGGTVPTGANDYDAIETTLNNYAGTLVNRNGYADVWYDYCGTIFDGMNEYSQVGYIISSSRYNTAKEYYGTLYTDTNGTIDTKGNYISTTTYYAKITDKLNDSSGCGFTYEEYNDLKKKMLSSVYLNGGFWIGQYEAGSSVIRKDENAELTTPVIQKNVYPYNWITYSNAQKLCSRINSGNHISSLMFGIQWDLILKHLEINQKIIEQELISDSTEWGNYSNSNFNIKNGEYSEDKGVSFIPVNDSYTKITDKSILLTTGITERNSKMNIYDLAGNLYEFTLERNNVATDPCTFRGGAYNNDGYNRPASTRSGTGLTYSNQSIGFRVTIY